MPHATDCPRFYDTFPWACDCAPHDPIDRLMNGTATLQDCDTLEADEIAVPRPCPDVLAAVARRRAELAPVTLKAWLARERTPDHCGINARRHLKDIVKPRRRAIDRKISANALRSACRRFCELLSQ